MDVWRWVTFGVIATSIWGVLHLYMGVRLIKDTRLSPPYNRYAWAVLGVHGVLAPIVLFARIYAPTGAWYQALTLATFVGMGFVFSLVLLLIVKDIFALMIRLGGKLSRTKDPVNPDRRALLMGSFNLGAFAVTGATTAIGFEQARKIPDVVEVELMIDGLAPGLDGFNIVQLSDIHIGPTLKSDFLEGVVDRAMKLDGDIILITGDLIDGYVPDLAHELTSITRLHAEYGVFFCTGNHEYYWDAPAWCTWISKQGIRVLLNEHELITTKRGGKLLVGGVTDYRAARVLKSHATDPHRAKADAPDHDFSVLMAHQPTSVYEAQKAGWNLQLSGHTHGGQFFPWGLFVGLYHEFSKGLGKLEDTWIYVSSGAGYWGPPNRFATPSEITRITLRRA